MKFKKWAGLLLAAIIMVTTMTGCLGHFYSKAMTVDGEDIPSGLYLMMQFIAYNEATNEVEDPEQDVLSQKIEEEDATTWIQNRAEELCRQYVAVQRLAAANNVTLSETSAEALAQNLEYWPMMEEYYSVNGIGKETIEKYLANIFLEQDLYTFFYGEEGSKAPSREEIEKFYEESNAHLQMFQISLVPDGVTIIEDDAEIKAAIDTMMEELESGEKTLEDAANENLPAIREMIDAAYAEQIGFDPEAEAAAEELPEEPLEETPAEAEAVPDETDAPAEGDEEAAGEDTAAEEEPEEETNPEIFSNYIRYDDTSGTYTEAFLNTLKEQKVGDFGLYEFQGTYMIYEKGPAIESDESYESMRDSIVQEMKGEEFEDSLKTTSAEYSVSYVFGARWFLSPKKIVIAEQ